MWVLVIFLSAIIALALGKIYLHFKKNCKVKSYKDEILIGEIVNVCADESVLTDGKVDPKKLKPIAYDPVNHAYMGLGEVVGKAFQDGLQLK